VTNDTSTHCVGYDFSDEKLSERYDVGEEWLAPLWRDVGTGGKGSTTGAKDEGKRVRETEVCMGPHRPAACPNNRCDTK